MIEVKTAFNYLGKILDQKVTFSQHVELVAKNVLNSYQFFIKQDIFSAHLFSFEFRRSLYNQ